MSNLGLEQSLTRLGIPFRRAAVGDRYVLAVLREEGGVLGGETSGHLLCLDRTTTGDGLVSALQVLAVMQETGQSLAQLASDMPKYPQVMINVRTPQRLDVNGNAAIQAATAAAERRLAAAGRVVLRASGTEPVIRVMVEASDLETAQREAETLAAVVRAAV